MRNRHQARRLILTRGHLCWLAEFPDDDELNAAMLRQFGDIAPIPTPYTRDCAFNTVRDGMQVLYPSHVIRNGSGWEYVVPVFEDAPPVDNDSDWDRGVSIGDFARGDL